MKTRTLAILSAMVSMLLQSVSASAQRLDRGLALDEMSAFTEKGTWMVGGTASWTVHDNDNYSFLMADGITSTGYKLNVSPAVCYMLKDNLGVGFRFGYSRSNLKLDEASMGFDDLSIDISNYHTLRHSYQFQGLLRNYIPIGNSKKIALYNEIQLGYRKGTSKVVNNLDDEYPGSFEDNHNIGLNFCPGIVAFSNDHLAIDVNVNMLGLGLTSAEQTHNQVKDGSRSLTNMSFQINILAIGFGLYYYL